LGAEQDGFGLASSELVEPGKQQEETYNDHRKRHPIEKIKITRIRTLAAWQAGGVLAPC
jgi:hypothetical protein